MCEDYIHIGTKCTINAKALLICNVHFFQCLENHASSKMDESIWHMAYFLIWSFPWHHGIIVIHKKYIDGVSPNQALDSIRTNQVFISPWYTKSFSLAIKSGVYRNNIIWFAWNWTFSSLTPTDTLTLKLYENPGSSKGVSFQWPIPWQSRNIGNNLIFY